MRRVAWLGLVLALTGSACSGAGTSVEMEGHEFVPARLVIGVGETVTWTNATSEPHTVTAYEEALPPGARYFSSGGFGSEAAARADLARGLIQPEQDFQVSFQRGGTYRYFCIPHEGDGMIGTIVVTDGQA